MAADVAGGAGDREPSVNIFRWLWYNVLSSCWKRGAARILADCLGGRPGICRANMCEMSSQGGKGECGLVGCGGGGVKLRML